MHGRFALHITGAPHGIHESCAQVRSKSSRQQNPTMSKDEAKKEVDLVNRDPQSLNGHLKVGFEDVLGEPDHAHSVDCLWRNSHMCFTGGKNCCYKFISVITGLCVALCWGCTFAMVAYENIWCITPCTKVSKVHINVFRDLWETYWDCLLGAKCKACGYMFSRIKVQQG